MMNIYQSITAAMAEGYHIAKDSRNQQHGFKYRGIDAVMNVFQPILSKYKIFLIPEVLEHSREERTTAKGGLLIYSILKVRFTFYAEDGSSVSATVIGEGMDSADKSSNKAMSIAMKYAMFQVFCIPTGEMADPDAETPEPSKPKDPEAKRFICETCGNVISDIMRGGEVICTAEEAAARAKARYGRQICLICAKDIQQNEA